MAINPDFVEIRQQFLPVEVQDQARAEARQVESVFGYAASLRERNPMSGERLAIGMSCPFPRPEPRVIPLPETRSPDHDIVTVTLPR